MQGLGLTEVAYQNAAGVRQGPHPDALACPGPKAPDKPADPIIVHPDVRRMLLTAACLRRRRPRVRLLGRAADRHANCHTPTKSVRKDGADLVALLTPIVKAFMTDNGFLCTSECLQVFGGHGYIREWGMEQFVRDARINMIYEGTNTIQSLDLLGRKILMDNGAKLQHVRQDGHRRSSKKMAPTATWTSSSPRSPTSATRSSKLTMEIGMKAMAEPDEVGAAAVPYLRVVGHLVYSYFWARMAKSRWSESAPMAVAWIRSTRPS